MFSEDLEHLSALPGHMKFQTLQYLAHVVFQAHILADFVLGCVAIVDVGAINYPINETDKDMSTKSKAVYFNSFAVEKTSEKDIQDFMSRLNAKSVFFMVFTISCCLLTAAILEYNKVTTKKNLEMCAGGKGRTAAVTCLRIWVAWFVMHPVEVIAAVLYFNARANGFVPESLLLLFLAASELLTLPRFLQVYRLPREGLSVFYLKMPLWAKNLGLGKKKGGTGTDEEANGGEQSSLPSLLETTHYTRALQERRRRLRREKRKKRDKEAHRRGKREQIRDKTQESQTKSPTITRASPAKI